MMPNKFICFMLFLFIILAIGELWFEYDLREMRRKHRKEFMEAFPGVCPICSYRLFGIREGYITKDDKVERHYCIEQYKEIGE